MGTPSAWPVRCGTVPPLADGFSARPESVPDFSVSLIPGAAVSVAEISVAAAVDVEVVNGGASAAVRTRSSRRSANC